MVVKEEGRGGKYTGSRESERKGEIYRTKGVMELHMLSLNDVGVMGTSQIESALNCSPRGTQSHQSYPTCTTRRARHGFDTADTENSGYPLRAVEPQPSGN